MQDPRLWQADTAASECTVCNRAFGFVRRRRHHCRRCGLVVCDACSRQYLWLRFTGTVSTPVPLLSRAGSHTSGLSVSLPPMATTTASSFGDQSPPQPSSPTVPLGRDISMWADGFDPSPSHSTHNKSPHANHALLSPNSRATAAAVAAVVRAPNALTTSAAATATASLPSTLSSHSPPDSREGSPRLFPACRARSSAAVFDHAQGQWWMLCRVCDACVAVFHSVLSTNVLETHASRAARQTHSAEEDNDDDDDEEEEGEDASPSGATRGMREFLAGHGAAETSLVGSDNSQTSAVHDAQPQSRQHSVTSDHNAHPFSQLERGFTVHSWLFDVRNMEEMKAAHLSATPHSHATATDASSALGSPWTLLSSSILTPAQRHAELQIGGPSVARRPRSEHDVHSSEETEASLSRSQSPQSLPLPATTSVREDGRGAYGGVVSVNRGGPVCPPHRSHSLNSPSSAPSSAGAVVTTTTTAAKPPLHSSLLVPHASLQRSLTLATGLSPTLAPPIMVRIPQDDGLGSDDASTATTPKVPRTPSVTARADSPHAVAFAASICPALPMLVAASRADVGGLSQVALQAQKVCIVVIDERGVVCNGVGWGSRVVMSGDDGSEELMTLPTSTAPPVSLETPKPRTAAGAAAGGGTSSSVFGDAEEARLGAAASAGRLPNATPHTPRAHGDQLMSPFTRRLHSAINAIQTMQCILRPLEMPPSVLEMFGLSATSSPCVPTSSSSTRAPFSAGARRSHRSGVEGSPSAQSAYAAAESQPRAGSHQSQKASDVVYTLDGATSDDAASPRSVDDASTQSVTTPTTAAAAAAAGETLSPGPNSWLPSFDPWTLTQQTQQQQKSDSHRNARRGSLPSIGVSVAETATPGTSAHPTASTAACSSSSHPSAVLADDVVAPITLVNADAGSHAVFKSAGVMGELLLDLPVLVLSDASTAASSTGKSRTTTTATATATPAGGAAAAASTVTPSARTSIASRWQWHTVVAVSLAAGAPRSNPANTLSGTQNDTPNAGGGGGGGGGGASPSWKVQSPHSPSIARAALSGSGRPAAAATTSAASAHRRVSGAGAGADAVAAMMAEASAAVALNPSSSSDAFVAVASTNSGHATSSGPQAGLSLSARVGMAVRSANSTSGGTGPTYMKALKQQLTLASVRADGFVFVVLRRHPQGTATAAEEDGLDVERGGSHFSPDGSFASLDSPAGALGARHASTLSTTQPSNACAVVGPAIPAPAAANAIPDDERTQFSGKQLTELYQHLLDTSGKASVAISVVDVWSPPGTALPSEVSGQKRAGTVAMVEPALPSSALVPGLVGSEDVESHDNDAAYAPSSPLHPSCPAMPHAQSPRLSTSAQSNHGMSPKLKSQHVPRYVDPSEVSTTTAATGASAAHSGAQAPGDSTGLSSSGGGASRPASVASGASETSGANVSPSTSAPLSPAMVMSPSPTTTTTGALRVMRAMEKLQRTCRDMKVWYGRHPYTMSVEHPNQSALLMPASRGPGQETDSSQPINYPLLGTALTVMATNVTKERSQKAVGQ